MPYALSRWMGAILIVERQHFPLWLPVFTGIGIAVYFALRFEPAPFVGLYITSAFLVLLTITPNQAAKLILAALAASSIGFASAQYATSNATGGALQKRTPFIQLAGTIEAISDTRHGLRLILTDVSTDNDDITVPPRIRLSVRGSQASTPMLPGYRISTTAALRPPPPPYLPGSYDFQRRAFFADIGAYGFSIGSIEVISLPRSNVTDTLSQAIQRVRADIASRARDAYPGAAGAVSAAMLTGHRGTIPEETLSHMRDAGIAHLLAISGLHIGLAAGTIFVLIRYGIALIPIVGLRLNAKKIASVAAVMVAFGYAILAGLTVPTERAFLMTSLFLIGVIIDRKAVSLRSVAWAAGLILILHPSSLLEPGYQMSFAAVICLVSAYEWLSGRRAPDAPRRILPIRYVLGVMLTSVVAGAATAPYAIYHFQHVAAFGLIANMIAVPLAAFWVIPVGLLALFLYPFGLDHVPLTTMGTGIEIILAVARHVASLPGAAFDVAPPGDWSMILITLGGLWLCLWRSRLRLVGFAFLGLGVGGGYLTFDRPDLVVDGAGRIVALRDNTGAMYFATDTRANHTKDVWRRLTGGIQYYPEHLEYSTSSITCDVQGCRLLKHDKRISVSFSESGLMEDCNKSDIMVALVPIRVPCRSVERRIDWFDLWRYGTHTIYVEPNHLEIRTVNQVRGDRPWVIHPPPSKWQNKAQGRP